MSPLFFLCLPLGVSKRNSYTNSGVNHIQIDTARYLVLLQTEIMEMPPPQSTCVPKKKAFSTKVNVEWIKMAVDRHIAALRTTKRIQRGHSNQLLQAHVHLKKWRQLRSSTSWKEEANDFSVQKSKGAVCYWWTENKIKEKENLHTFVCVIFMCNIYFFGREEWFICQRVKSHITNCVVTQQIEI